MIDRRGLLVAAAVGPLSASALAQDDKTKLRDTLLELEIGSWQFTKDKNAAAMNSFLADDAVLLMGDGNRFTKAQFVKFEFEVTSFTVDRASAQLLVASPDVAILLYRVTYISRDKGGPSMTSKVAASDAYVRRGGRWQSLYYQETPLK
jgi:ketosteroid isomerase-like protein